MPTIFTNPAMLTSAVFVPTDAILTEVWILLASCILALVTHWAGINQIRTKWRCCKICKVPKLIIFQKSLGLWPPGAAENSSSVWLVSNEISACNGRKKEKPIIEIIAITSSRRHKIIDRRENKRRRDHSRSPYWTGMVESTWHDPLSPSLHTCDIDQCKVESFSLSLCHCLFFSPLVDCVSFLAFFVLFASLHLFLFLSSSLTWPWQQPARRDCQTYSYRDVPSQSSDHFLAW